MNSSKEEHSFVSNHFKPSYSQPSSRELTNKTPNPVQFFSVLELMQQDRLSEALDVALKLKLESQDSEMRLLLATLFTNLDRIIEAEKVCAKLLEENDLNADAHYLLALCRERLKDDLGAIHHDRTSIYLDPIFSMPHIHLGFVLKRLGDKRHARREFKTALDLLTTEDTSRILLFGGGFHRDALSSICRREIQNCEEAAA
jgi:chemotaxis protein methyltransferase CheR